jgi:hypothetical protein
MAEPILRCPYCVLGDQSRLMIPEFGGWFICENCAHAADPDDPEFNCTCAKCRQLHHLQSGTSSQ